MSEIVLVAENVYGKGEWVFRACSDLEIRPAPAGEEELASLVVEHGVRAVVLGVHRYVGPLYEALAKVGGGRGALMARFGVGHDGIDKALAKSRHIFVTNTPGVLDASVAEHTFWLMGSLTRNLPSLDAGIRAGRFTSQAGCELFGKRLAVMGLGPIGRQVAKIAHFGFGMRVSAAARRTAAEIEQQEGRPAREYFAAVGVEHYTTNPDELLAEADVVSLHVAASPATHHFIGAERLARMKPEAMLVNTSRGSLIDEAALYDALAAGRLAGAALDVFEVEPYQPVRPDKDLRSLTNVVLTPHVGSNTLAANRRMAESCVANLSHFFAGEWEKLNRVGVS
jgi:lactate dehydrogenase-like 2-hydroxyacid dehydrogenase